MQFLLSQSSHQAHEDFFEDDTKQASQFQVLMGFQTMQPSWNESRGKKALWDAISRTARSWCKPFLWLLQLLFVHHGEKDKKADVLSVAPWSLVPERGCCAAARGRMKLKKTDAARAGYSASLSLTIAGQYWLQAGHPTLVSPLPATSFSLSATNTHLSVPSGVPKHTSMFPQSCCSKRRKTVLGYLMEPLNLVQGQGTMLRIMARA